MARGSLSLVYNPFLFTFDAHVLYTVLFLLSAWRGVGTEGSTVQTSQTPAAPCSSTFTPWTGILSSAGKQRNLKERACWWWRRRSNSMFKSLSRYTVLFICSVKTCCSCYFLTSGRCCAVCRYFDVPMEILPKVRSSSEIYGWMVSSVNLHCLFCVSSALQWSCLCFEIDLIGPDLLTFSSSFKSSRAVHPW